ncbi:MAG TPA: aminotransferase class I/II-fold pyridoxal phosphate-dependent enzyme, partial [Ferruginibacter sp.]|nr:aminotransferase class I/II-fold pyridoxal phosphate-dependent enzyme [Ferruginibacter sp.]
MDISYILNEFAEERGQYFNAVSPPIVQTSNFVFNTVDDMRKAFANEYSTYLYSRGRNPTVDILRRKLAALDGADDCLVFSSGAAAIFAAVLANVKSGDHIVSVDKPYTWAQKMFNDILPRFGVSTTYIDGRDIGNFERAILPNTSVIYLESPNSWDYALQDLKAVAELAKAENIVTIIDNSYCSPLYQRPIEYGIDLAMQTATKYISGHSDTLGGVLSGSAAMIERIFNSEYMNIGSGIQPFNAWLLIRGMRTWQVRFERLSVSIVKVVDYLKHHPKVESVIFPFDESFPQYELAKKQMSGACGLLTFVIKAETVASIEKFCESLQHIFMAVSWGGHESLIIPKCSGFPPGEFDASNREHR